MANEQNTASGALPIAPTGNPVLDAFAGFTNILGDALPVYSSWLDSQTARRVAVIQATSPPMSVVTTPVANPWTPDQLAKAGIWASVAAVAILLTFKIVKKVV